MESGRPGAGSCVPGRPGLMPEHEPSVPPNSNNMQFNGTQEGSQDFQGAAGAQPRGLRPGSGDEGLAEAPAPSAPLHPPTRRVSAGLERDDGADVDMAEADGHGDEGAPGPTSPGVLGRAGAAGSVAAGDGAPSGACGTARHWDAAAAACAAPRAQPTCEDSGNASDDDGDAPMGSPVREDWPRPTTHTSDGAAAGPSAPGAHPPAGAVRAGAEGPSGGAAAGGSCGAARPVPWDVPTASAALLAASHPPAAPAGVPAGTAAAAAAGAAAAAPPAPGGAAAHRVPAGALEAAPLGAGPRAAPGPAAAAAAAAPPPLAAHGLMLDSDDEDSELDEGVSEDEAEVTLYPLEPRGQLRRPEHQEGAQGAAARGPGPDEAAWVWGAGDPGPAAAAAGAVDADMGAGAAEPLRGVARRLDGGLAGALAAVAAIGEAGAHEVLHEYMLMLQQRGGEAWGMRPDDFNWLQERVAARAAAAVAAAGGPGQPPADPGAQAALAAAHELLARILGLQEAHGEAGNPRPDQLAQGVLLELQQLLLAQWGLAGGDAALRVEELPAVRWAEAPVGMDDGGEDGAAGLQREEGQHEGRGGAHAEAGWAAGGAADGGEHEGEQQHWPHAGRHGEEEAEDEAEGADAAAAGGGGAGGAAAARRPGHAHGGPHGGGAGAREARHEGPAMGGAAVGRAAASSLLFTYGGDRGFGGAAGSPYDEPDVDPWSSDDDEEGDTTAEQFYDVHAPKDIQGIPWERLQFTRSHYRETRLKQYRNYTNVLPDDDAGTYRAELAALCVAPRRGGMSHTRPALPLPSGAAAQQPQPQAQHPHPHGAADDDLDDAPAAAPAAPAARGAPGGGSGRGPDGAARPPPGPGPCYFSFVRNSRAVQSNIVHFQLRNLVWATSRNDVFVVHDNCINHWSPATRIVTEVLNLGTGAGARGGRVPGLGRVQVSTLCVHGDLVAAGGFMGELVVKRLSGPLTPPPYSTAAAAGAHPSAHAPYAMPRHLPHDRSGGVLHAQGFPHAGLGGEAGGGAGTGHGAWRLGPQAAGAAGEAAGGGAAGALWAVRGVLGGAGGSAQGSLLYCGRITNSDNGITNGLEIVSSPVHGTLVMASNNDASLRLFAAASGEGSLRLLARWPFDWAVNYATMRPGGHVAAVVGDDPATVLTDVHNGINVASLQGHRDYSFAAAWHPGGHLLATGNQDTTCLVWDVRRTAQPLVRLAGRMGAIRSLRFSADGRFLAMSEPADFVHVYDVGAGFTSCQELDFFGEIAGVSFTPDASSLFVGVSDLTYASLMHFERQRCAW